jgi:hypothetical protein
MTKEEKQALHNSFLNWAKRNNITARILAEMLVIKPQYTWALLSSKNQFNSSLLGKMYLLSIPDAAVIRAGYMERIENDNSSGISQSEAYREHDPD